MPQPNMKRAFEVKTKVAVAAFAAVAGVCTAGAFVNCLTTAIASVALLIISGFRSGATGELGGGAISVRDAMALASVRHTLPNGTVAVGFHPYLLDVGTDHRVSVGKFEALATRLTTGHVRISAKVDQGSVFRWRRTDDDPGHTKYVDALYNDLNIGRTGLRSDGGNQNLANHVGEAVAQTMIGSQAETVCAALINGDTNGEIIATEWFIRAGDGSSGSTPSGACDNA
ncbi:hypothetical protein NQ176_g3318 [Zarea fungicola]|uniref:Uncharacterized protein n=1 Tax=Zarea fungicola TaxID=93591 RepID=A0ACC1NKK3_9HYPO|nr:hypothetical protein NQ176_g3318 [Lecanicillium fungicola]